MEIKRLESENELQYLWRLGQAKDSGSLDFSWNEISDLMNCEFRNDESEYRTESAYRKIYQYTKKCFDNNVFGNFNDDEYLSQIREEKQELRKEKQKLFDERAALNRKLRNNARIEEDLSILRQKISDSGKVDFSYVENSLTPSDNDLIIVLSDFHLGSESNNNFGAYNSDIAAVRLSNYLTKIAEIQKLHNSQNAYVLLLGDLISGNIHPTVQLENRENLIEQVQKAAEYISKFVYELSTIFGEVYVNGVAGNHSRASFKDSVLRNERLDNLIPWYMKAKLECIHNVIFIDGNNYDATIGRVDVRGHEYIMVHGDFDSFSESGVSKLVMMLDHKPSGIFYGHLHRCSYDDIAGVRIIRSGSFSGTSDDYTISKRLSGKPSQMVCVANADGIQAYYPIYLV